MSRSTSIKRRVEKLEQQIREKQQREFWERTRSILRPIVHEIAGDTFDVSDVDISWGFGSGEGPALVVTIGLRGYQRSQLGKRTLYSWDQLPDCYFETTLPRGVLVSSQDDVFGALLPQIKEQLVSYFSKPIDWPDNSWKFGFL